MNVLVCQNEAGGKRSGGLKNLKIMGKSKSNREFEDSDVFKRRSLNSAKNRKLMARVVTIVLEVLAVLVLAWVVYAYMFE